MPVDDVKWAGLGPRLGLEAGFGGIEGGEEGVGTVAEGKVEVGDSSYSEKVPVASCMASNC